MKQTTVKVKRFKSLCGWVNRILRIDLNDRSVRVEETAPYVPTFLGGRGIAARIAWNEYREPVEPFSERNPLMIFAGALTGSRSPYSGRAEACAFSPQSYPHNYFSRSNMGGHFGGELKRAGYDGIVVTGASERPVRILIRDDEVSILPAEELWGTDALDTLEGLESGEGRGVRSLAIGPAGEHLSRMATIQTASSSACGQGGFGAVMGSKKLKAISVVGTGKVSLADAERIAQLSEAIGAEARTMWNAERRLRGAREQIAAESPGGSARAYACTEACVSPCNVYYRGIRGLVNDRTWDGHWACVAGILRGIAEGGRVPHGGVFDWRLGLRGGFEMNALTNRYGINQWELIIGMVPWLEACQGAGLIGRMDEHPMDWRSPAFWAAFLHALAYREGMGDALAEGGCRAAHALGLGEELLKRYYTAWGYAGHWDGHADWANYVVYPFWLPSVLQWMTDTRDPIPSGHGYVHGVMYFGPFNGLGAERPDNPNTWDDMRKIGERIYGGADALDPYSGYRGKAQPAFWHTKRSVMKDCLPVDDFVFPMIHSPNTPDHFCRVAGLDGPSLEYHLFKAGTGTDWSEEEFERAAQRVYTLERALAVRHWGRDRSVDESALPSFEYTENWQSPLLGECYALDRGVFKPVADEYYALQGWDPQTGRPTERCLRELGLGDVFNPMLEGALHAKERLARDT